MKKRCSFCKKEIGFFVKECPYCYETQGIPKLVWSFIISLLLIGLIVGIFIGINS